MFVLDTDICVHALRGHLGVLSQLRSRSPSEMVITAITEAELEYGVLRSRDPIGNRTRLAHFTAPIRRLPFETVAAAHHAATRLALRATPISERGLLIASIALAHGATLVTTNEREFRRVPKLALDNWARRA